MKEKLTRFFKGGFLRALMVLAGGSLIANLFTALQQPLLTRIFSAEQLGAYSYLTSIPLMFIGVVCARYDAALVYEEDESKLFALLKLNIVVTVLFSAVVTVLYAVYLFLFKPEYVQYWYLLPVLGLDLMGHGFTNILNAYNNRNGDYQLISRMNVIRTAIRVFGVLIAGVIFISLLKLEWLSMTVLLLPACAGLFFGMLSQAKNLRGHWGEILRVPWREVWASAKRHCKQPLLSMPALFIEGLYNETLLGYYSISTRLLGMPLSLISGNVSKVYVEQAAKEYAATGGYRKTFKKTFLFLLALAIPMFLVMYFLAPPVCEWLFGEGWHIAGKYIKILALMFSVRFIATAVSPGLYVCRKQQHELVVQLVLLAGALLAGGLAFFTNAGIEQFLWYVCALKSLGFGFQIFMVYYFSNPKVHKRQNLKQRNNERERV